MACLSCVVSWLLRQVHEKVKRQAINVMDLYAKRARIERTPCRPDGPEMVEFCSHFPHEPTPDQVRRRFSSAGFSLSGSTRLEGRRGEEARVYVVCSIL